MSRWRTTWLRLSAVLVVAVVVTVGLAESFGGSYVTQWWDNLGQFASAALASLAAACTARRLADRRRRAYTFIAIGTGCWALGEGVFSYYQLLSPSGVVPSPGLPDIGFLLLPLAVVAALVCYPAARLGGRAKGQMLLDGLVVASSLFLVSWTTALGDAFGAAAESALSRAVNTAYPAGDVILVVGALTLVGRTRSRRTPLLILSAGLAAVAFSDSAFVYLNAVDEYLNYPIVDAGWWCGFLLVAVGALAEPSSPQPLTFQRTESRWQLVIALGSILPGGIVLLQLALAPRAFPLVDLVAGLLLLTGVMSRLLLALLDNRGLVHQLSRSEVDMRHQAFHDSLTGLPNRAAFTDALRVAVEGREMVGIVYVDLDDFKLINDSWGHPVGDQLLCEVARRLRSVIRTDETVARLGGDEFAVLVRGAGIAENVAQRLLEALAEPAILPRGEVSLRASVGVVERAAGCDPDTLLRDSDTAMYVAKRGGGGWRSFVNDEHVRVAESLGLRGDIRQAIEAAERDGIVGSQLPGLHVAYQPIVATATAEILGYEALARWNHPQRGVVRPDVFVRIAEECGLAARLDRVILRAALCQISAWRRERPELRISVNASPHHVRESDFAQTIVAELAAVSLPGAALIVEVTESALLADPVGAGITLEWLRAAGIRIALDDFGTGWSSLHRLTHLPVNVIKVDRAFVTDLGDSPGPMALSRPFKLLAGIIGIGAALGVHVCVEGIETPEELEAVRAAGADSVQGYLLGRPAAPTDLPAMSRLGAA